MKQAFTIRVRIVTAVFVLFALVIMMRLYVVQIMRGEEYKAFAETQYVTEGTGDDSRYDIFFRDKENDLTAAAVMESTYRVAINPTHITDAESVYEKINAVTPIDRERFFASAAKTTDPYEEITGLIKKEEADAVRALNMSGVSVVEGKKRAYPGGERAAHVLGFVGFKDDARVGRYGLERYFEDALGKNTSGLYVNFFAEIFSSLSIFTSDARSTSGHLVTFIEPTVEQRLEEALTEVAHTYDSRITGGIIMDPRDGSIIALAAVPTFNPNTYNTEVDVGVFANPLVESVFEFGSIMKPLTMASGIDGGAVTPETVYNDTGFIIRDDAKISNFDGEARGRVPMQEVLNQSLNTGAAFIAEELGQEKFTQYMFALGFGEETGIDLPGEVQGIISGLKSGSALDLASASFGQGVAITPIAMARALSTIANGGVLVTPHISDYVRTEAGLRKSTWYEDGRRVFSEETADTVTKMLITVVDEALLEGKIKQERHSIAAKTGTAQMAKSGGGYYDDRYLHSFFGYLPAYDPQFLIFLFTVEPKGVSYASQTLTEPFSELAQFLISYYNIPPDR